MNTRFWRYACLSLMMFGGCLQIGCTGLISGEQQVQIGDKTVTSHRAKEVEPGEEGTQNVVIRPSPEFLLEYAFGDGLDGFNILRIEADGSSEYQYWDKSSEQTRQKKVTFEVSPDVLEAICSKLNESGYMALANEYHGDVAGGTQVAITVVTGHVEKEVYCDNHFPVAVVAVADYLEKEVIQPNRNPS